MGKITNEIEELVKKRQKLRSEKKYNESDKLRKIIKGKGYLIEDTAKGQKIKFRSRFSRLNRDSRDSKNSLIAIFGSGEMSPTGRKIHEYLIQDIAPSVKIALLETPTGFEANPHYWYERIAQMLQDGLQNYKPVITKVPALRRDGPNSTNDPSVLKPLLESDYIHTGAGSPSYAARHLKDTLAYEYLRNLSKKGTRISFASATAIAFGKYLLPVYEIYKAGEDLHWKVGLDFFSQWGLNLTIIPHWNNTEGGKEIDTSRCYMGEKRIKRLLEILPGPTTIMGIDEQTACIFNLNKKEVLLMGVGGATIIKNSEEKIINPDSLFSFAIL